jgi:Zn-dependent peptidase ImmA (M78 family)/transcriptional regulator with XRE-family HTH domain
MRLGTPGFLGARLKEARESRSMTGSTLADVLGVTRQAVSRYESGELTPSPEVMHAICACLNLPHHFFFRPVRDYPDEPIFWRSMSAATKMARSKAERRLRWLREMVSYLEEYVNFPPLHFPRFDCPSQPTLISDEMIEEIASEAREFWKLRNAPITDLVWLLEQHSTVIARDGLDAETLDALSVWGSLENRPYIILNKDKQSAIRSRTDTAHELGHLLLHRNIKRSQLLKTEEHKLIEDQAFRFARAFLLPSSSFANDVYALSLDALRSIQSKWKVSLGVMVKRAEDLGLIGEDQTKSLWISLNRRGWKFREPFDAEIEIETPKLLSRVLNLLITEQVQTKEEIRWEIPYAPGDIEALSGLEPAFWKNADTNISISQKITEIPAKELVQDQSEGRVLTFSSESKSS